MCVIVDANLAARVFGGKSLEDYLPLLNWLDSPEGGLVYGGHLASELFRVEQARRWLRTRIQSGRARAVEPAKVEAEEKKVRRLACRSDDPHVLALARVSGARTLCSEDRALQEDFGNPKLISKPRGAVYTKASHSHLLKHTSSCGRLKRRR